MYQEAEPIYQRALAMAENGLGADHPVLIKILKPYSLLLEHSNRKEEAQKMAARYKMLELQNGGPPKETALDGASTQDRAGRPN
jgi:hypothetical protein